ncbi:MAG: hypothetical protein AAF563_17210 [Pseudomonadota bacterium]
MRFLVTLLIALFISTGGASAQSVLPTSAPDGAEPLTGDQIRALLGSGQNFSFVGVGAPITGTTYWDLATGTASGNFAIADRVKGHWGMPWSIDGDRNCLTYSPTKTVCSHIYAHGDGGFMEVYPNGTVHTVYTPMVVQPLPVPLEPDEVKGLLSRFLDWNQQPEISVQDVRVSGDSLVADFVHEDGSPAWSLQLDRATGWSRVPDASGN